MHEWDADVEQLGRDVQAALLDIEVRDVAPATGIQLIDVLWTRVEDRENLVAPGIVTVEHDTVVLDQPNADIKSESPAFSAISRARAINASVRPRSLACTAR